jgi:hypothetical protein
MIVEVAEVVGTVEKSITPSILNACPTGVKQDVMPGLASETG